MDKKLMFFVFLLIAAVETLMVYVIYQMFQIDSVRDVARGMLYGFIIINVALAAAIVKYFRTKSE